MLSRGVEKTNIFFSLSAYLTSEYVTNYATAMAVLPRLQTACEPDKANSNVFKYTI